MVITNLMITVVCVVAWYQLKKHQNHQKVRQFATYFLFFMTLATLFGGLMGHAFLYKTGIYGKIPGWYLSMIAVALLERAAIIHITPLVTPFWGRWISILNIIEILTLMTLSLLTMNFLFVQIHAFFGLFLVVFLLETFIYRRMHHTGYRALKSATFFGLLAAISHSLKFSFHQNFNYEDISHVFMMFSTWMYYRAFSQFNDYDRIGEKKVKNKG